MTKPNRYNQRNENEAVPISKRQFVCIAADVVQSRNQHELPKYLTECVHVLNETFENVLHISFQIRNGDEIIGVLTRFSSGYEAAIQMKECLQKVGIDLYIGVGYGPLDDPYEQDVHRLHGPAVWNAFFARDQMLKQNRAESRLWSLEKDKAHRLFAYSESFSYQAVNALIFNIVLRKEKRSAKQNDTIEMVERYPHLTYEEIGKKLGYSSPRSNVSQLLARANYQLVREMEHSLSALLQDIQHWLEQ
jgi:hypothetical protein